MALVVLCDLHSKQSWLRWGVGWLVWLMQQIHLLSLSSADHRGTPSSSLASSTHAHAHVGMRRVAEMIERRQNPLRSSAARRVIADAITGVHAEIAAAVARKAPSSPPVLEQRQHHHHHRGEQRQRQQNGVEEFGTEVMHATMEKHPLLAAGCALRMGSAPLCRREEKWPHSTALGSKVDAHYAPQNDRDGGGA